jgi:hypothetical protein
MAKAILKKTESKVAVKLYGTALNETITLATDCLASTELLTVGGTPTVNILAMHWSGAADAVATITRNSEVIATLPGSASGELLFHDSDFTESINNTSNLVITSTGLMQVWIVLRKISGYSSKIETAQFSVYDNINAVGS